MNSTLRVKDFLGHILEAINRIESYTLSFDQGSFEADAKTQDAVIRILDHGAVASARTNRRRSWRRWSRSVQNSIADGITR